jgi:disulfide bond formation protein DsbB
LTSSEQKFSTDWNILFTVWLIACIGTLGSLFFSEAMEFAPCALCWYQRIFLYPMVITLATGLFPLDKGVIKYSLPLAVGGWFLKSPAGVRLNTCILILSSDNRVLLGSDLILAY